MAHRTQVTLAPTLARMAEIYGLSRAGGRHSPRFAAYRGDVAHQWGLAGYNPMAGDSAAAAVDALITLDAERLAQEAAQQVIDRCGWTEPLTLAVVVATPGMWTDRVATEARNRTTADRRADHGEILLWSTDEQRVETVETESTAEAVRTMWTSLHGPTRSLQAVLAREGMAYALAHATPSGETEPTSRAAQVVNDAIEILGDTTALGDIVAVLYGDEVATALGYAPLGIAARAGFEFATSRAHAHLTRVGAARALRAGVHGE